MSNETAWFANSAVLSLTVGGTVADVAAIRNVRFTPHFETAELYGIESTHVLARAKYQLGVDVSCEYAMWNPSNDFVLSTVLQGQYTAGTTTAVATDSDTAAQRSKCALFNMTASIWNHTRTHYMIATVYNIVFPEVPFEMRENEFISRNLAGKGESVSFLYVNGT